MYSVTDEEITNGVGALAMAYAENEKKLSLLMERLRSAGHDLSALAELLARPLEHLEVGDRGVFYLYSNKPVTVDGVAIWDSLRQYHEAITEKMELEARLTQAGLGVLIKTPD